MKNETGRSMVEMLGVLAIIGVLSIGGIAGYTLAMRRYRANEVVNLMSIAGIYAMTAKGGEGQDIVLSEHADYHYYVGASYGTYETLISPADLGVTSFPKGLEAIIASKGGAVVALFEGGSAYKIGQLVADIMTAKLGTSWSNDCKSADGSEECTVSVVLGDGASIPENLVGIGEL